MTDGALTIKLGGTAGGHAASLEVLVQRAEPGWVLVHGGGGEVGNWSRRLGIEPRAVDGLRVTDPETLEIAVAVLRGLVNARLVATFVAAGAPAIGLAGADGDLLRAERIDSRLGEVGRVTRVNESLLEALTATWIPIVAPIARGTGSDLLNVNADEVAGAIAAARRGRLLLLTDVPGVIREGAELTALTTDEAEEMLADGSAADGMRPKLRAAITAARAGCSVAIVDGTDPDAVRAALDGTMTGTTVTAASAARLG